MIKRLNKKTKPCYFCVHKNEEIDYKNVPVLRRFISSYMKIAARRRSGLCTQHQRKVAKAIKQARIAGLLPFVPK